MFVLLFLLFRYPYVLGECNIHFQQFGFCKILGFLWRQMLLLYHIWFLSGSPYRLKLLDRKFLTSLVPAELQIFTVGQLLNLSIAINICTSPCIFLFCNFPVKSICISWPGRLVFLVFRSVFLVIDI